MPVPVGRPHPMSDAGTERRRSPRLPLRVPVMIACGDQREASWTVSVSENGALVTATRPIESGQRVSLLNVATGRSTVAWVVAPLLPDAKEAARGLAGGDFRIAIRLDEPDAAFWGPAYARRLRGS